MSKQIPENHAESHQDVVDRALYEAAKNGDLPAAFVAIQRGASLKALHDIVCRLSLVLHLCFLLMCSPTEERNRTTRCRLCRLQGNDGLSPPSRSQCELSDGTLASSSSF